MRDAVRGGQNPAFSWARNIPTTSFQLSNLRLNSGKLHCGPVSLNVCLFCTEYTHVILAEQYQRVNHSEEASLSAHQLTDSHLIRTKLPVSIVLTFEIENSRQKNVCSDQVSPVVLLHCSLRNVQLLKYGRGLS